MIRPIRSVLLLVVGLLAAPLAAQDPAAAQPKGKPIYERMDYGSLLSHTIEWKAADGSDRSTPKGLAIRVAGDGDAGGAVLFDVDTCRWVIGWTGEFLELSGVIFNGSHGPNPRVAGTIVQRFEEGPRGSARYRGIARVGGRVGVIVERDGKRTIESPTLAGTTQSPLFRIETLDESQLKSAPPQWPQVITTVGTLGSGDDAYVVDTLTLPEQNPWDSWMRLGGLDFFADGTRAAVSTWSGDVWIVSGIDESLRELKWKRFAAGLFQPLGLRIVNDQVVVNCRDGLYRLDDLNADGEADVYTCLNSDVVVTPSFHEFALDLQTDPQGNFYFAKGGAVRPGGRGWQTISPHNGTVIRISADGSKLDVFATGIRAPNGMGAGPNGEITVADNEGTWTPACRLNFVKQGDFLGVADLAHRDTTPTEPGEPICWFPHAVDNSSGGQVWVSGEKWGPFAGRMLHTSYGMCDLFLMSIQEVEGVAQGWAIRFPLSFASGIHRGRINPRDGQVYLAGLKGWQTRGARDGCLQRVRYTGKPVQMPTEIAITDRGIDVTFTNPLDEELAEDVGSYNLEAWNYLWSGEYGSKQYRASDPASLGRDSLDVTKATLSADGKTVSLEVPTLTPAMQMKLQLRVASAEGEPIEFDLYGTVHRVPGHPDRKLTRPTTRPTGGAS